LPLEVRQIGIRFSVEDARDDDDAPQPDDGAPGLDCGGQRRLIVEQCVRAVLEELKRAGER